MFRQILAPLDGSPVAETILPTLREFAHAIGAGVTLLHIVDPLQPHMDDQRPGPVDIRQEIESATMRARHYLSVIAGGLAADGLPAHVQVIAGPVAEEIVEIGRSFDLIAMATHGRSGIGRWVYGSVADKVLRGAHLPVLLIRAGVPVADDEPALATTATRR